MRDSNIHAGSEEIFLNLIIIIITLFQEDNIFGTDACLTYGPPLTDIAMLL